MSLSHALPANCEELFQQIDRIIKSHSLRASESLCRLLQYLAKETIENPDGPLKEYQIATEVYGRNTNFDPQSDSTVRVQAGRLRAKLAEYYANEGAHDVIVVTIPKGNYHLSFEVKEFPAPAIQTLPPGSPRNDLHPPRLPAAWQVLVIALAVGLAVSLTILGILLWNTKPVPSAAMPSSVTTSPGPLAEFWRPFTSGAEKSWVIYSNAAFVGRPETGMRYHTAKDDPSATVYDHYTGVGEVLAIHALDEVFDSLGRHVHVKRSSLFTLDDAGNANLIFVGSPSENLPLADIPSTQHFVFQRVTSGPRKGDLSIVNHQPRAGEAASYLATPSAQPLTDDYAVIGFVPGKDPGLSVMILAGTTTFGTQGAVEFVSNPKSVQQLLENIPGSAREMRPFEALLHIRIARGVPIGTELVALRLR